jgi:glycosyltransferase involved in cell wall biosynthesis
MNKNKFSVVIIAKNEEKCIERLLKSVSFADEIILVDSGSTDKTLEIAKLHQAKIIHQDWLGYGAQKIFACSLASNDWVLCLDADEYLDEQAKKSIQSLSLDELSVKKYTVISLTMQFVFLGKKLSYGAGLVKNKVRFFDKTHHMWNRASMHESVQAKNAKTLRIPGKIIHNDFEGISDFVSKINNYTTIHANNIEKSNGTRVIFSTFARFIKFYFLKFGFMDGWQGFIHILILSCYSGLKYAKKLEKN